MCRRERCRGCRAGWEPRRSVGQGNGEAAHQNVRNVRAAGAARQAVVGRVVDNGWGAGCLRHCAAGETPKEYDVEGRA